MAMVIRGDMWFSIWYILGAIVRIEMGCGMSNCYKLKLEQLEGKGNSFIAHDSRDIYKVRLCPRSVCPCTSVAIGRAVG